MKTSRPKEAPIKYYSDYQRNWPALIAPLRQGRYEIQSTDVLSIHGDAPKDFIKIKEHVPGRPSGRLRHLNAYIAKVGSKFYPNESITEQLLTRIGQALGIVIADSQLRFVGRQVRFLSKYFLRRKTESLVHGIEIFKHYLDEEFVEEIAQTRSEQEFYTFQTVCAAIEQSFPDDHTQLTPPLVEMLAFDAIIGHHDRHPANWGLIVPVTRSGRPRFSPVYDTARALFWNLSEVRVAKMLCDQQSFAAYIRRSTPQIGFDGCEKINHFELVGSIFCDFPKFRPNISKFAHSRLMLDCGRILDEEFSQLMSEERRELIKRCLFERHRQFCEAIT